MNDYLELIAAAALSNALVATLLGVVAWVASRWAKPTVAHALWLLVLLKLVTPPLFETRVPLPAALAFEEVDEEKRSSAVEVDSKVDALAYALPLPATSIAPSAELVVDEPVGDDLVAGITIPQARDPFVDDFTQHDVQSSTASSGNQLPSRLADWNGPPPQLDEGGVFADVPPIAFVPRTEFDSARLPAAEATVPATTTDRQAAQVAVAPSPHDAASQVAATSASSRDIATLLLALWFAGSVAWFALALTRIQRFRRMLRRASPATPPLAAEVAALAADIGLARAPEVLVLPGQVSPLVCTPLGRAVLVLPRDLLSRFSHEQRTAVIAHELAHLRRRDHWTRWLELIAVGCYWWLPTVWFARRQLHAAEEACCDAWVVWLLPERSRDYARALLETIDFLTPAPESPLLASGFGRASTLKRRFDMILKQRASHRLSWPARAGMAAVGLVILPWSLAALSADESPKTTATIQNAPASGLPSAENPPSANNATSADSAPSAGNPPAALPEPPGPPSADNTDPAQPLPALRKNKVLPTAGAPGGLPDPQPVPGFTQPGITAPPVGPPASLQPTGAPRRSVGVPVTPELPPGAHHETALSNANVLARLERLEATTAELLVLVKQLRDERHGLRSSSRYDTSAVDEPVASNFIVRYGHADRQLDIEVAGRQVTAVDNESDKRLWSTELPWNVTSLQGAHGNLMAASSDGRQAVIDPSNGAIKATLTPAAAGRYPVTAEARTTVRAVPPPSAKSAVASAERADSSITKIEMELLAAERQLAQQRADLQHEVRQMETRRARLVRKFDALTADVSADERAKLTAQLEEAEDQLASMQHKVDTFEADLEFKVRELQLNRDQLLRARAQERLYADPDSALRPSKANSVRELQR